MNRTTYQALLDAPKGGASSRGLTYHGRNLECPKKARLNEVYKALTEGDEVVAADGPKLNWMHVGIYGHKLFELYQQGKVTAPVDVPGEAPAALREAARIWNAFHAIHGSVEEFLGLTLQGAEVPLGETPEVADEVRRRLGDVLTGRLDAVGTVVNPDALYTNTGQYLLPGRWIIDWKFGQKHGAGDALKFSTSLQAANYCFLDELHNPGQGALGVIFVRLIGHKNIDQGSFVVYVCPRQEHDEERLRSAVQLSMVMEQTGLGNPMACVDAFGRECFFRTQGICPGY